MGSMHEYSVKGIELKTIKIIIIVISVISAFVLSKLINMISLQLKVDLWMIEIPSVLGFYELLTSCIDKYLWKHIYQIPSFEGIWKGSIKSSFDNYEKEIPLKCIIKQNAKMISIVFEMEKSNSYSISAVLDTTKTKGASLEYDYINVPKVEKQEELDIHLGRNTLYLKGNELEGEYFNNQRNTNGKINLVRVEEN